MRSTRLEVSLSVTVLLALTGITLLGNRAVIGEKAEPAALVLTVNVRGDWVEGYFEAGWPVFIQIEDSGQAVKATARVDTGFPPWFWGASGFTTRVGAPWEPAPPNFVPGDWVLAHVDPPGVRAEVRIGEIEASVDLEADTVAGTITAPWLSGPLGGFCILDGRDDAPSVSFQVDPDGGEYSCDFGAEGWDLAETDPLVVGYQEPDGHQVMNQFLDPVPQLGTNKSGLSAPTPAGNFEYVIHYWNLGDASSEANSLTDTLPEDMIYLGSTLGIEPIVIDREVLFDLGPMAARSAVSFSLFAAVNAPLAADTSNQIGMSSPPWHTLAGSWNAVVQANDTDLTIVSTPSETKPLPDSDLLWHIEVCNVGATSSASAELVAMLPSQTPPLAWWADQTGWLELAMTGTTVVVARPTVPGGFCLGLHLETHVPATAIPGQEICNDVTLESDNDLDALNNSGSACVVVGGAAPGIEIEKSTNGRDADLPPGPVLLVGTPVEWTYRVTNSGNMPLEGIVVEDDQPGVVPVCPATVLDPGDSMTCEAGSFAVEGQYANLGTAAGTPWIGGDPVVATDPSHYFGQPWDLLFEDGFESGDASAWSQAID